MVRGGDLGIRYKGGRRYERAKKRRGNPTDRSTMREGENVKAGLKGRKVEGGGKPKCTDSGRVTNHKKGKDRDEIHFSTKCWEGEVV